MPKNQNEKAKNPIPKNKSESQDQVESDSMPHKMSPVARHNARYYALQAIYQWQLSDTSMPEIEIEFLNERVDKPFDRAYFKDLLEGVNKMRDELAPEIEPFLKRAFTEIGPVELAILRLSVYELLHRPDVPPTVVINEALELSKQFGSDESHKFINSILDRVAKKNDRI